MSRTAEEMKALVGQPLGTSDWLTVSQNMIDRFADATHDHQFIHVDPDAAAKTPFGGTVAHGFLTLSLLSRLVQDLDTGLANVVMGINYGFDRVRMISPVPAGARVRGRFDLAGFEAKGPGRYLSTFDVTVDIENAPKPALKAVWLGMQITGDAA